MPRRFEVDSLIGEYRVTRFLGEGGMGEVYLGVHEKLGRPAAIKILGQVAKDESFRARFFNEARLQANLHHANIATLYDFQQLGDELLIFMEFVDGESLDDLVTRRAFTIDDALVTFRAICEAVGYMHSHGVVHRDIKAQNVKLRADGSVKLLDFGIAKDESSHGLTQTGGIVGTPNYLSPEQLRGAKASPQTDVWALGVLLYEMLTGKLPFEGDSLGGLVLKITSESFEAPDRLNPAVPREVARIVAKCLEKEPSNRYRTVAELVGAVSDAISNRGKAPETVRDNLKKTFGLVSSSRPESGPVSEPVASDAAAAADTKSKSFPMGLVAALGGAAIVLVVLVIGVAFWIIGGDTAAANGNAGSSNSAKTAAGAGTQRVRVDVDEGKAQVIRDGQVVGTTPLDIDVVAGEKPNVTLRRDGFEDKTVQIEPASGKKVLTFSLKPASSKN